MVVKVLKSVDKIFTADRCSIEAKRRWVIIDAYVDGCGSSFKIEKEELRVMLK